MTEASRARGRSTRANLGERGNSEALPRPSAPRQRRFATRQPQHGSDVRRAIRVARSAGG